MLEHTSKSGVPKRCLKAGFGFNYPLERAGNFLIFPDAPARNKPHTLCRLVIAPTHKNGTRAVTDDDVNGHERRILNDVKEVKSGKSHASLS